MVPSHSMPLTPALMLWSPTWVRTFPQTVPTLRRLLARDGRLALMNLVALRLAWDATKLYAETHASPPIIWDGWAGE